MIRCTFENDHQTSLRHVTVDALIFHNDKILLVRRAQGQLEGGKWALAGGFVERDEDLLQAVKREIKEETGYEVDRPVLLTIRHHPDRPHEDRQNISFVFICQAVEKTSQPDHETETQQWFKLTALPPAEEIAFDHARNIELYQSRVESGVDFTTQTIEL